jgi:hypothetical protein
MNCFQAPLSKINRLTLKDSFACFTWGRDHRDRYLIPVHPPPPTPDASPGKAAIPEPIPASVLCLSFASWVCG